MESESTVITVQELLDLCKSDGTDLDSMTKSYLQQASSLQFPDLLNDHLYWSYKHLCSDDISPSLVTAGMLRGSKRTGRVRLVDHTASIDCVIAPTSTGADNHQCSQVCTLPFGAIRSYYCPYLHISALGNVVKITRFQVVAERFVVSCFPTVADMKNERYVRKMHVYSYLMFSMPDVVCMRRQFVCGGNKASVTTDNLCGLVRKDCILHESCDTSTKRTRLDSVPESLLLNQQKHCASFNCAVNEHSTEEITKSQQLSISPDGCGSFVEKNHRFLHHVEKDHIDSGEPSKMEQDPDRKQQAIIQDETSHPMTHQAQMFLVKRKDALRVKHRVNSKAALSFFAAVQFLGEVQTCTSIDTEASSLGDSLVIKHVVLDIYGNAVSLYAALHAGCLYKLVKTCPADSDGFSRLFSSGRLKKALELTDTCQCIRVDDNYKVMPVCSLPTTSLDRQIKVAASRRTGSCDRIYDVCHSERRAGELVSFCGHIERRTYMRPEETKLSEVNQRKADKDNEKLGVSVPQDRTLRVVVRDCRTPDSIVVYVRPHNISYPLGLLKATLVEFRQVERCVSKKGVVYCQYISASSVQVVGLTCDIQPHWTGCGETSLAPSLSSTPLLHLRQLIGPEITPRGSTVFQCALCQVERVLSLTLRQMCVRCSRLYRGSRCGCEEDSETSVFTASACFTIDDGTGTSIVYCNGNLVRQLLALSASQWSTLQLLVKEHDVRYAPQWNANQGDCTDSDIERYIQHLCSSTKVQRQVTVFFRKCHSSGNREESSVTAVSHSPDTQMTTVYVERQTVVTHAWPTLRLQLVAMETVDHHGYAAQLMVGQNSAGEKKSQLETN